MTRGKRLFAICPRCRAAERHRLQALVVGELRQQYNFADLKMLHVAPEEMMRERFAREFGEYVTGDLTGVGVDLKIDLTAMDLPTASVDVIYASHVLEHIRDDGSALSEIARVLRPGGFAVLPVPIVGLATIEYPAPVPTEEFHVRGPGPDYYDRYTQFDEVKLWRSRDFDEIYQLYIYEDRSTYPNPISPYREPTYGARHEDIVAVAFA